MLTNALRRPRRANENGFASLRRSAENGFAPLRRSAENGFTPLRRSAENGFTPLRRSAENGFTPLRRSAENGFTPLRRSAENGFTLVELMVVIVILGLLATIVAFNVIPLGDKGKITAAKADIAQIDSALEVYKLQNDTYPSTGDGLQALVIAPADADASKYQRGGYIKKLPLDPWGKPYLYAAPGQHGDVDVWTLGADHKEGGEGVNADIGSWQ